MTTDPVRAALEKARGDMFGLLGADADHEALRIAYENLSGAIDAALSTTPTPTGAEIDPEDVNPTYWCDDCGNEGTPDCSVRRHQRHRTYSPDYARREEARNRARLATSTTLGGNLVQNVISAWDYWVDKRFSENNEGDSFAQLTAAIRALAAGAALEAKSSPAPRIARQGAPAAPGWYYGRIQGWAGGPIHPYLVGHWTDGNPNLFVEWGARSSRPVRDFDWFGPVPEVQESK